MGRIRRHEWNWLLWTKRDIHTLSRQISWLASETFFHVVQASLRHATVAAAESHSLRFEGQRHYVADVYVRRGYWYSVGLLLDAEGTILTTRINTVRAGIHLSSAR